MFAERAAAAGLRRPQPPADPAATSAAWATQFRALAAEHARRAGRDHRRAAAPGRRRHVRLRPRVPARAARGRRRARPGAGLRRDRDRVRPDRHALRRRGGRRRARHHVRRQGADRRLPDSGRGALHRRGRPRALGVGVRRADARPDLHGQPAGLRGRARQPRPAARRRLAGRRAPGSSAGLAAGLEPLRGLAGVADVRTLGAVGVVQLDHPVDVVKATERGRRGGRVAAAVPRPRLHDAAVRHLRRGPRPHLRRRSSERWRSR